MFIAHRWQGEAHASGKTYHMEIICAGRVMSYDATVERYLIPMQSAQKACNRYR